jgi:HAD superfamily hydrolase (TIGR01549 family)
MRYRAILFDLFDTLVHFDRERLPLVQVTGRTVRSTAGHVHAVIARHVPAVTLERCYEALLWSWEEAERRRAVDHREVPAPERLHAMLGRLGLDPAMLTDGLVAEILHAHQRALSSAADFPPRHGDVLRALAQRHRLALVSNFDYSPTAIGILEQAGVVPLFQAIVVSDAIGWRKPKPLIFEEALRRIDVGAGDALFVGDRLDIDVAGAHAAGMHAAWLNRKGEQVPPGVRAPELELRNLDELLAHLGEG